MAADNCYYQLSIHRDGRFKYFCTDKEFRSIDREGWRGRTGDVPDTGPGICSIPSLGTGTFAGIRDVEDGNCGGMDPV